VIKRRFEVTQRFLSNSNALLLDWIAKPIKGKLPRNRSNPSAFAANGETSVMANGAGWQLGQMLLV